jgi:hypothetical protein
MDFSGAWKPLVQVPFLKNNRNSKKWRAIGIDIPEENG